MISLQYLNDMGLYNKWQNENLFSLCEEIGETERNKERGMYFKTIHATLDHILKIDNALWLIIHEGQPKNIDFKAIDFSSFAELWAARKAFDEKILNLSRECNPDWLCGVISLESKSLKRQRNIPRGLYFMQMFNHQTHHRSQITSELHKLGKDYGNTDMPYNPFIEY